MQREIKEKVRRLEQLETKEDGRSFIEPASQSQSRSLKLSEAKLSITSIRADPPEYLFTNHEDVDVNLEEAGLVVPEAGDDLVVK